MNALKDNWAWLLLLAVIVFGVFAYAQMKGSDNLAGNAEKELVDVDSMDDMSDATSTDETASSTDESASSTDEMEDKEDMVDAEASTTVEVEASL